MPTTHDLPPCPNTLEGQYRCARSDVFVERETHDSFVIRCRTCNTVNIWPKQKAETQGRYEAKLRLNMIEQQKEEALKRKRTYSY